MVCPYCGNQVPKDALFCDCCGSPLSEGTVRAYSHKAPQPPADKPPAHRPPAAYTPAAPNAWSPACPEPAAPSAPQKKRRWLLPLIIGLAVLAVAAAGFALWFFSDARAYGQAQALYQQGQYAQAEASFRALGDYKDSADRVDACRYQQAKANFDRGNYALAQTQFEALGSYSDSAEQVKACRYQQAMQAFDQGDTGTAAMIFEALGDYKDSADWLLKCRPATPTGTWYAQINLAEVAGDELGELAAYLGDANVDLILELKDDNSFTLQMDGTALLPVLKDAFRAYLNDMLSSMGMTAADYEAAAGQSVDALIDEALAELDISELNESVSGTYTDADGSLTLSPFLGTPLRGSWEGDDMVLYDDDLGAIRFTRR
jgi:outer membrane protein assembly factor BamD (BamD/ComL family)